VGGGSPGLRDPDKPFEECRGIGHSFAWNRLENWDAYLDRDELVQLLIEKVSRGGGLLLNLGPAGDGRIPVIQQDRLIALGEWLNVNGESIYGTRQGLFKYLPWGKSTTKGNTIYLHVFDWPADHTLKLPGLMTPVRKAYLLHDPQRRPLKLTGNKTGTLQIELLGRHPFQYASVIALELEATPEVSNRILPDEHGTITLPAELADLTGGLQIETTVERLGSATVGIGAERTLSNIGFWTNPSATATWTIKGRPDQVYHVEIEWACAPGYQGGVYKVRMGDRTLTGRVDQHTNGWKEYSIRRLGTLSLGNTAQATLQLKAGKIPPGKALMNVRRIILKPVQ